MSFDFSSATEYQRRELHKIAHNCSTSPDSEELMFSDFLFPRPILWFFLTLDGKRDICEVGSFRFPKEEFDNDMRPTEILDSLPITYSEEIFVYENEGQEDKVLPWWHICSDGRDIDAEIDEDMSSEDWGRFYDYPEWAIQAFVDDRNVNSKNIAESELGFSLDELKYLQLLPYTVSLEESHIRESIKKAKRWADRIEELAEEYEYLSGLSYRLEEVLSEQKEWIEYERYRRKQGWDE